MTEASNKLEAFFHKFDEVSKQCKDVFNLIVGTKTLDKNGQVVETIGLQEKVNILQSGNEKLRIEMSELQSDIKKNKKELSQLDGLVESRDKLKLSIREISAEIKKEEQEQEQEQTKKLEEQQTKKENKIDKKINRIVMLFTLITLMMGIAGFIIGKT